MPEKLSLADLTQAVTHIMYYEHSHDLAETWSPREMLDRIGERASGNLLKITFGELQAKKSFSSASHIRDSPASLSIQ